MAKSKRGKKLGTTKETTTQTSFSSSSISSLESENVLAMDLENTELASHYSPKERIDAQVDALRLISQVNMDIDKHYNILHELTNHQVKITIFGNKELAVTGKVQGLTTDHNPLVELSPARVDNVMVLSHVIPLDIIDEIIPLDKPDYSTKELANLMEDTSCPVTSTSRAQSRSASRVASRSQSRAASRKRVEEQRPPSTSPERAPSPKNMTKTKKGKSNRKRDRKVQDTWEQNHNFSMTSLSTELSQITESPDRKKNTMDYSQSFGVIPDPEVE